MRKLIYKIFFSIGILTSAISALGLSHANESALPARTVHTIETKIDDGKLYFSDVIRDNADSQLIGAHYSHSSHTSHSSHKSHYSHVSSR